MVVKKWTALIKNKRMDRQINNMTHKLTDKERVERGENKKQSRQEFIIIIIHKELKPLPGSH